MALSRGHTSTKAEHSPQIQSNTTFYTLIDISPLNVLDFFLQDPWTILCNKNSWIGPLVHIHTKL